MDRKAIVQGLYKKLKIREIATLSKCGLATVQRTKDYLQNHNIPLEEAIEFTESQLQALFDQPHRKPDVFVEEDFAEVFRKVNRVKLRMSLKDCWYQYKKSHEQSSLEVMGYKIMESSRKNSTKRQNSKNADAASGCRDRRLWLITVETDCLRSSAASTSNFKSLWPCFLTRAIPSRTQLLIKPEKAGFIQSGK